MASSADVASSKITSIKSITVPRREKKERELTENENAMISQLCPGDSKVSASVRCSNLHPRSQAWYHTPPENP